MVHARKAWLLRSTIPVRGGGRRDASRPCMRSRKAASKRTTINI